MLDRTSKIVLRYVLHFSDYHRGYFFRGKGLFLPSVISNFDLRLAQLPGYNCERPMLHVLFNFFVSEFTTNQALRIKYCVQRVHCGLNLSSLAHDASIICEGHK
mmetsp:Transcript_18963/g.25716  ORF Transcript_18963/g.25716 Transcript_18963/m.25716 type:complete len:104 (+) Transcript_18963:1953-2264(+)